MRPKIHINEEVVAASMDTTQEEDGKGKYWLAMLFCVWGFISCLLIFFSKYWCVFSCGSFVRYSYVKRS